MVPENLYIEGDSSLELLPHFDVLKIGTAFALCRNAILRLRVGGGIGIRPMSPGWHWERPGVLPDELEEVSKTREVWPSLEKK